MVTAETIRQALRCGEPGCTCSQPNGKVHCPTPGHPDIHPSLSVNQGNDGKVLVKCQSQCKHDQNLPIAALKARNLWPSSNGNRFNIVATYDYHDPQGKLVFQVCRTDTKEFPQRRPDGAGGWIWKMTGIKRYPYNLPKVLQAETVVVVEGEKDADAIERLGFVGTTSPGGASEPGKKQKWRPDYNPYFHGKQVIIFPDNDPPGRAHAHNVGRNLQDVTASIKVVELPGLPEKGDVSDWLMAGGTREQLQALVDATQEWTPPADDGRDHDHVERKAIQGEARAPVEAAPIAAGFNLTDLGNGQRLAALHGRNLKFCYPWEKWLAWDGRRYRIDDTGEVDRRAKAVVQSIYGEAAAAPDKKQREALANHALKSESEGKRKAMIASARSEPDIPILPEHLDIDPWLFNVLNGTIDLKTGTLHPHRQENLITKMAPVEFAPRATCPTWIKFLNRILAGNPDLINFLQKAVGYSLTGNFREQVLFFLWGLGANGKSTLLDILQQLMGDYATRTSSETFLSKKPGGIPNDVAALRGARLVAAVEVEQGRRLAEVLIKEMTGGDTIAARFLHAEWFTFRPQFKIFLATNHKPLIRGTGHAIWRRIRLLPFTVQIPKDEQDRELPEKLKAELPGILNWAIAGCLQWRHGGLEPPKEVTEATQVYRDEMDILADFIAERCLVAPGETATAKDLYSAYTSWSEAAGEKRPLSQRAFGMSLTERGFERKPGTAGRIVWHGINLKIGK